MEKSDTLLADSIPQEQISLIVVMDQNPQKQIIFVVEMDNCNSTKLDG
jgi:hypothetical protein